MNLFTTVLVVSGVVSSATAQILLKAGTNSLNETAAPSGLASIVLRVFSQPFIIAGIGTYVLSMVVWLAVLSRLPVSVAYPLLSLGYIITALLAFFFFNEPLTIQKIIGILVIISGVFILTSN